MRLFLEERLVVKEASKKYKEVKKKEKGRDYLLPFGVHYPTKGKPRAATPPSKKREVCAPLSL